MEYTEKKERARNFVAEHLKEDILDPKNLPLRETSLNWAISLLRLVVTAVNVVYSTVQLIFSLLLAGGDLLAKGLNKLMPAPKIALAPDRPEVFNFRDKDRIVEK